MLQLFKSKFLLSLSFSIIASAAPLASAQADGVVRYVSTAGDNANNCLLATPCRTLQRGINQTPTGGELRVLESGNYGATATVTKSMTLSGVRPDVTLSRLALTINAPGGQVALTNLHSADASGNGIYIAAASHTNIEGCVVESASGFGIFANGGVVTITNTAIRGNDSYGLVAENSTRLILSRSIVSGQSSTGIVIAATATGVITDSILVGNLGMGIWIRGGRSHISRSVISGHSGPGVGLESSGDGTMERTKIRENWSGLTVDTSSSIRVSGSSIIDNRDGDVFNSGTILTNQNNIVGNYSGSGVLNNITPF